MSTPFTHTRYVPRGHLPVGIPNDAVLIYETIYGSEYGWCEKPVIPPSQAELDKMREDANKLISEINTPFITIHSTMDESDVANAVAARMAAPPIIGNVDGATIPRIKVSWEPDPEPEPDFFADYVRAAVEKRRRTIDRFLIATFDITEEEQAVVKEVLAGKDISTIHVSGRGHGKTRRAWAWERLMKRLREDPLPPCFWPNVSAYRMLTDTLGRDIIHTLTRDRA